MRRVPKRILEREWSPRTRNYLKEVVRCTNIHCKEPEDGIWVTTPVTVYVNGNGDYSDNSDIEWSSGDTAGCPSCETQGVYDDFSFCPGDFLIYPRDMKDLAPKEAS